MNASVRAAQLTGRVGAGVGVAGNAEGAPGNDGITVDDEGAVLGDVDVTQPPMIQANQTTVMRRAARCREGDLMPPTGLVERALVRVTGLARQTRHKRWRDATVSPALGR